MTDAAARYFVGFDECPVKAGAPCPCPIGHCPVCGYTRHDAIFHGDHERCGGEIPAPPMPTPAPPPPAPDPHEPKEPRPGRDFEREHFEQALGCYRQSILDTLADEADSSMTREDVANARRREAKELDEVMSRWDTEHDAAKELAAERDEWKRRAEKLDSYLEALKASRAQAEAERDAARAELADPRIAAWRALDAEQRSYRVEDLRTWADLVEAGAAPDGADHGPSPLRIAAAALEALGEK